MTRPAAESLMYLVSAIFISVFLIMSVTAVEKPAKTDDDHADDDDSQRRGAAIGRRKVNLLCAHMWQPRRGCGAWVRGCGWCVCECVCMPVGAATVAATP